MKISCLLALLSLAIACGDEVKNERRTVTVEKDENNEDATRDQQTADTEDADSTVNNEIPSGAQDTLQPPTNPAGTTLVGALVAISPLGEIEGWAVDEADLSQTITIAYYVDRPAGGTPDGEQLANQAGFDGNQAGNHRFSFTLEDKHRDGNPHTLTLIMKSATQQGSLFSKPQSFVAYAPSQEGQEFYQTELLPSLNLVCQGCHPDEVNYNHHYALLLKDPPSQGGTATNNHLITKASGGLNHGGGNQCGNLNGGVCGLLQQWWQIEFE